MASRGKGARVKGASYERAIAALLSEYTGYDFKRGLGQTRAGGNEIADVYCDDFVELIHIECKRHKRTNPKAAYQQALNDAPNKIKIIITRSDREPNMVTLNLDEFLPLLKLWLDDNK